MKAQTTMTMTMRVEDVAEVLGISRNAAYVGIRNGQIPSIRVGRRVVVPKAAVERMLAAEPRPRIDEGRPK